MKLNKRAVALLVSLVALLAVTAGITVAYIFANTEGVTNTFTPSRVACEVVDETNPANEAMHTYTVENTGDTDAYIRAAIAVNWKKDNSLYAKAPEFTVTPGDGWVLGSDGYYYFTQSVAPGAKTGSVLTVTVTTAKPDGYELLIEVVASAVQATTDAVKDWSKGIAAATVDGGALTVTTS